MPKERDWVAPEKRKPLTRKQKAALFIKQDGRCQKCTQRLHLKGHKVTHVDEDGNLIAIEDEDGAPIIDEHVKPLWAGGANAKPNRQLWCVKCATFKTAAEATERATEHGKRDAHIRVMPESRNPLQGGRKTKFKRCMDGRVINRETGKVVRQGWR